MCWCDICPPCQKVILNIIMKCHINSWPNNFSYIFSECQLQNRHFINKNMQLWCFFFFFFFVTYKLYIFDDSYHARSQDRFFGGCGTPKMWTSWTQKVDFLSLTPLNPFTKTLFLAHFVTKSGPFGFGRFGGCIAPPWLRVWFLSNLMNLFTDVKHFILVYLVFAIPHYFTCKSCQSKVLVIALDL